MSTTENWLEARTDGGACLHRSGLWLLVYLDRPWHRPFGWYLFGPGAEGVRLPTEHTHPALARLDASRKADAYLEREALT